MLDNLFLKRMNEKSEGISWRLMLESKVIWRKSGQEPMEYHDCLWICFNIFSFGVSSCSYCLSEDLKVFFAQKNSQRKKMVEEDVAHHRLWETNESLSLPDLGLDLIIPQPETSVKGVLLYSFSFHSHSWDANLLELSSLKKTPFDFKSRIMLMNELEERIREQFWKLSLSLYRFKEVSWFLFSLEI